MRAVSFDHLVGAQKQRCRHIDAERLGGLEIYDRRDLGRPLHRQIARLGTLENLVDEGCRAAEQVEKVRPICHESAVDGVIGEPDRGQALPERERGHRCRVGEQHRIVEDHERADPFCRHRRKSSLELGRRAHVELVELRLSDWATCLICGRIGSFMGFAEFIRMPTSVRPGMVSLSSLSRLAASSGLKNVDPVTLPSGRARLDTRPDPKASPTTAMTMGIVVVAFLAARTPGVPWVTITSTLRRTRSASRAASRSYLPSAQRYSMTKSRPS